MLDPPDTIRQWYKNCQQNFYSSHYVHFVTTDVWSKDIKQINKNPNFPEWHAHKLLLIKLTNLIHQGSKIDNDILEATSKEMNVFLSVPPTNYFDTF